MNIISDIDLHKKNITQKSIILVNEHQDKIIDYLKFGNIVINLGLKNLNYKSGLIEGFSLNELKKNKIESKAWLRALVLQEDDFNDIDLSFLKDSEIDWVISLTECACLVEQAWKYRFRLWMPNYRLSQQEIPEKIIMYLNSRPNDS